MWANSLLQSVAARFNYHPATVTLYGPCIEFEVQVSSFKAEAQQVERFLSDWLGDVAVVNTRYSDGARLWIVEVEFRFNA